MPSRTSSSNAAKSRTWVTPSTRSSNSVRLSRSEEALEELDLKKVTRSSETAQSIYEEALTIALVHTTFNVINTSLLIGFITPLAAFVTRIDEADNLVARDQGITGEHVAAGDVLVGLRSPGLLRRGIWRGIRLSSLPGAMGCPARCCPTTA